MRETVGLLTSFFFTGTSYYNLEHLCTVWRVDAVGEGDLEVQAGFVEVSTGVEVVSGAGGGAALGAGGDAALGWCF